MPSLKPKYEAFCQFYAESPHAGIAAENAGYTGRNVDKQGWRLLQRPEIVAQISRWSRTHMPVDPLLAATGEARDRAGPGAIEAQMAALRAIHL